jgi:hypothetical protein
MNFQKIFQSVVPALLLVGPLSAQPNNYQGKCQQETANRLRVNQRDVSLTLRVSITVELA